MNTNNPGKMIQKAQQFGSDKARLMISNMVLENFKSYAGVQEIGPFHKSFSSIVGPNGSGKSNVIDAMLFVFGKRAKKLRLNKVSELIHKSSNYPNLQYATIKVNFQMIIDDENDLDKYEIIPGSSFTITRTAFKDNSSKYTLDGKNMTFTQVGKILRDYGIDLDNNRFLILQGEVEQISMMKPKGATSHDEGLLEYLEDIIGSNHYVEKIEEVNKELIGLNEIRASKMNLVKVAERERDNLCGAKDEAEEYLEKERMIMREQNILYQLHLTENTSGAEKTTIELENVNSELNQKQKCLKEYDHQLKEMATTHTTTKEEYERVVEALNTTQANFAAFERRDVKLQEDMKHCKAFIKKFEIELTKNVKKEEEAIKSKDSCEAEVSRLQEKISITEKRQSDEQDAVDAVVAGLAEATAPLREKLEGVQTKLVDEERSVASLRTEKDGITMSLELCKSRATKAKESLDRAKTKLSSIEEQLKATESRLDNADEEQNAHEEEVQGLESDVKAHVEREEVLHGLLREAVSKLEEARASVQNSKQSAHGAVAAILKASKKGSPLANCGVRGRLGDLGSIDEEYDVAISTACGQLDFIVVDTTAGAQRCVKFLRDTNAGRASFVVLEQMKEWAARMSTKTTPAPRLFDLVRTEEIYKGAFYMALRDTLVVSDLDSAVKVAYEGGKAKWRVVAQDGNLIDTSGAMSGGGKQVKSGGMKAVTALESEYSSEEITSFENESTRLASELKKCRSLRESCETSLKKAKKTLKGLDAEFKKLQTTKDALISQQSQLIKRIESLLSEAEMSATEIKEEKEFEMKLLELEKSIDEKAPALKSLQAEVDSLQKQIGEIGGPKLKNAQHTLDAVTKELDGLLILCSAKEVELANAAKALDKAMKGKQKTEKEVESTNNKLEKLKSDQMEMETDALAVVNAVEEAKKLMITQEEELNKITESYRSLEEEVANITSKEVDLITMREELSRTNKEYRNNVKHWEKELRKVQKQWRHDKAETASRIAKFAPKPKVPENVLESEAVGTDGVATEFDKMILDDKNTILDESNNAISVSVNEVNVSIMDNSMMSDTGRMSAIPFALDGDGTRRVSRVSFAPDSEISFNGDAPPTDISLAMEGGLDGIDASLSFIHDEGNIRALVDETMNTTLADTTIADTTIADATMLLQEVDDAELPVFCPSEIEERRNDKKEIEASIVELEEERDELIKLVNMGALMEYYQKEADVRDRLEDLETVTQERNSCRKKHEDLRRQRLQEFMAGFDIISLKLKEMYQLITLGGDAELELVDSLDPFSEGIVFSVRPPKKSWKNITNLSGGEKTLSSLALVFALHHFKPTPLYVMDEIDAALDFKNVSIVANYIKERTRNAQFVIISLRNNMFELADRLVGIYKTNDATKSVTIDPKAFANAEKGLKSPINGHSNKVVKMQVPLADATNTNNTTMDGN